MEKIEYGVLMKDSVQAHLSTQEDSCILLNGSKRSKASYDLRSYIDFDNDDSIEYVTLSMPYAVITNSNYIISNNNNTISVTFGGTPYTYTIPNGNYTVSTFITYLTATVFTGAGFSVNFNTTTNKITINYTGGGTWGFISPTTCDYNIGFQGTPFTTSATSLTMPFVIDFLPIPRFIFHCNLLNDGLLLTTNSTVGATDVLASIPNNAKLGSQIIYENYNSEFLLRTTPQNNIIVTITNDNSQEIDFNNIACYFVLRFNVFRKSISKPLRFNNLIQSIKQNTKLVGDNAVLQED
jgi:hypothetical protein